MTQDEFELGYLLGLLVGEGHFGSDGYGPQIVLKMHVRHEKLFRWLQSTFPGGRLYGPYCHGGRTYYQWMVRGTYLREHFLPAILRRWEYLDDHLRARIERMCERHGVSTDPRDWG